MQAEARRALSVCLINPKFDPSFWGFDFALPLLPGDKRCWAVTGALPALAALAPPHCTVTLLDENIETLDFAALSGFDVIGVTGMLVQRRRMREILAALGTLGAVVAVGGPYVSVAEQEFEGLCDVRFIGEAEETWPQFLHALGAGLPYAARYEQAEKTDMHSVPAPRYDLVRAARYHMATLQFSRGCPFTCEFCDIITIFGRRPRLKSVAQVIAEIESVRRAGFHTCFLVDDNLIGNKKEVKKLLAALAQWQAEQGYPLQLSAEASIDLAEEPELLELMVRANMRQVFIGIESPRRSALAETRKVQNLRGAGLLERIDVIRAAGLVVQAGFIVGFDSDDEGIFEDQFDFIQASGISQAVVAILSPIPTTPLYARLAAAGRLDPDNPDVAFRPALMSQDALKAGHDALVKKLYTPHAYFERIFAGYAGSPGFRVRRRAMEALIARARPGKPAKHLAGALWQGWRLWRALAKARRAREIGGAYAAIWRRLNRPLGAERLGLGMFIGLCVTHWHFFNMANRSAEVKFGNVAAAPRAYQPVSAPTGTG